MSTIRLENVAKIYKRDTRETIAILDIDLRINQGEFVFLVGSRGAGKSTLMDIIYGTVKPDRGIAYFDDIDLSKMNRKQSAKVYDSIARVSQNSELDPMTTIFDNMSTIKRVGFRKRKVIDKVIAEKALGLVGMSGCGDRYPRDLTLSERKRVEVARAILKSPDILMLDDFPDKMDDDTTWDMLHLISELNKGGTTIIMATNMKTIVDIMRKRVITLSDGRIVGDVQKGKYGYII